MSACFVENSLPAGLQIIPDNVFMVKCQRGRQIVLAEQGALFSIGGRLGSALSAGQEYRGDAMHSGIPVGCGVGVKLTDQLHIQTRFFLRLPHRRLFQRFSLSPQIRPSGPSRAAGSADQ